MTDRTVKVRIAVAVDQDDSVAGSIVTSSFPVAAAINEASYGMEYPTVWIVEADVPRSSPPQTIPATVTKAEEGE